LEQPGVAIQNKRFRSIQYQALFSFINTAEIKTKTGILQCGIPV